MESGHDLKPDVELLEEILGIAPEHYQVDYEPALYLRDV